MAAALPARAAGLPVACGGAACAGGPSVWVSSGAATSSVNGAQLDIRQTTDKAILNWAEFNVGAGNTVNFQQPGSDSLAINRIFQDSPSKIFGQLNANGQVYLLNRNGILFGGGSQVNVRGLVASSLDIADIAASGGILNPSLLQQGQPAFAGDGRVYVLDQNGQVVTDSAGAPVPVKVSVEQGATIMAAPGGRVALLGQQVENAGKIEAPDGQVVLAAGQKVYLQASSDPALRGLLVEVDAGGEAWNRITGDISSARGNVTLVGLAVNQAGRVSATTSTRANGSIRLLARDTVNTQIQPGGDVRVSTRNAGTVTLAGGSRTEILPDPTDTDLAIDEQTQVPSSVEVVGRQIEMQADSLIHAPGGHVAMTALPDPDVTAPGGTSPLPEDPGSSIRLRAGSAIDVSGSAAEVSVTRNLVEVELRSNELRDSPAQRDGALRGKTVVVDARVGTPLADVSSAVTASLKRDVRERTSSGGTVSFASQGSIAIEQGATVDVSGGTVTYTGAVVDTSKLVTADGRVVDIGSADPAQTYRGVFNPAYDVTSRKWGTTRSVQSSAFGLYDPGYVEGGSAGTVSFAAPQMLINGSLLGQAVNGPFQRDPADRAAGGRLIIGSADGQGLGVPDFRAPSVQFTTGLHAGSDPVRDQLWLSTDYLTQGGFERTEIYSNGVITVPAAVPLQLAPGAELSLRGAAVDVGADIVARAGTVSLSAVDVNDAVRLSGAERTGVHIGDGVAISVDGVWVNDLPELAGDSPRDPIFTGAGTVNLSVPAIGGELVLGEGVRISADGGAWLNATGKLAAGDAGSIAIQARGADAALETGAGLQLSAWGLERGGSLTLAANQIRIGSGPMLPAQRSDPMASGALPYEVGAGLFSSGGFGSFQLVATGGRLADAAGAIVEPLTVSSGALVEPRAELRALAPEFRRHASGEDIATFSSEFLPQDFERQAAGLSLAVEPHGQVTTGTAGDLLLEAGSRIDLDPRGTLALSATRRIVMNGNVVAPGGLIEANLLQPRTSLDFGFDPEAGIVVGDNAHLNAAGTSVLLPSDTGLRRGDVLAGGGITLSAVRGTIDIASGAVLDVSGSSTLLDLPTAGGALTRQDVASRGGLISLLAPEGMRLGGELRGAAGGSGPSRPEGGTLEIGVSRLRGWDPRDLGATFPGGRRQIVLTAGSRGGGAAPDGTVVLDPGAVTAGGFDNLTLQADDAIVFDGALGFALGNRLALQAPNLEVGPDAQTVSLSANTIALGPRLLDSPPPAATQSGSSSLELQAGLIDVFGDVALHGIGYAVLAAGTDIRFSGRPRSTAGLLTGSLAVAGDLTLRAAQLYPTTYSSFVVSAAPDAGGRLDIVGNGGAAAPVLAGAGALTFRAADITQAGVVRAPLGEISFEAVDSLTLSAGSLTSTSAAGQTVPFGRVVAGTDWVYESVSGSLPVVTRPPEKSVSLSGRSVTSEAGATVDVSGGGDLYAYEFVPGPGGSKDALVPGDNPNLFAILPAGGLTFAPFDSQESAASSLQPGDSVHLDGVAGVLAAGNYALLPARYALLPGALLVEAVDGSTDLAAGQATNLPDGAPVVAGYRTVAGTLIRDSRTQGFAIRPGDYARELAEFRDSLANQFFADAATRADQLAPPRLPRDAGDLRIVVGDALDLGGTLRSAPATGGRGARVDLSARNLEIVDNLSGATPGVVEVEAAALHDLGAASLLLGGTRNYSDEFTDIDLAADSVTVAADTELGGAEIILAARGLVTVSAGAQLRADGAAAAGTPEDLRIAGSSGGSLVRVSRNSQATISRAGGGAAGDIEIDSGAQLVANGSITVDAAGTARSFGTIDAGGGALSLGSRRIVLGNDQEGTTDGLALSNQTLASFDTLSELRLGGADEIDINAPAVLGDGARRPGRLILDTPLISGGADAALAAGSVVLTNAAAGAAPDAASGAGTLRLSGDEIAFGDGAVTVSGFAATALRGANGVRTQGDFTLRAGGDLLIESPAVVGAAGSSLAIQAPGGLVRLTAGTTAAGVTAGLGAALDVEAREIEADNALLFPSGGVRLAAQENLSLGTESVLEVGGRRLLVGPVPVVTPGGEVTLIARAGDVSQAAGASIDVSAGDAQGTAGTLSAFAGGRASLDGTLLGAGSVSSRSGTFRLYAGNGVDFDALNASLNAGGFNARREIETGGGDITVAAGSTVRADDITLAASGGSLNLLGILDASAADGGRVVLAARDDLTLAAGSRISAGATGPGPGAGAVSLLSSAGQLRLESGAGIDVSGGAGATDGTVLLRARASADDINIATYAADIAGAGQVTVEPVLEAAAGSVIDAAAINGLRALLDSYMSSAGAAIRSRLALDGVHDVVRPGLELVGAGDVTLSSEWNFSTWRFDGQPGYLTLRTPGQLQISADLSDGFVRGGTAAAPTLTQLDGPTWSYRLVGGAATDSALPWATAGRLIDGGQAGGVRLADNHAIRTGTGSISIAADADLSLAGRGSVIYTAGVPARPSASIGIGANARTRYWLRDGGDITLAAGRDIAAVAPVQIMSGWNVRNPGSDGQAEWAVDVTRFQQGVSAMAGGDVRISAGRDITNLSASVLTTRGERPAEPGAYDLWGGGNINVSAGRDIGSGVFSTWQGEGMVNAGRSIVAASQVAGTDIHTMLSAGPGSFTVNARRQLELEGFVNPTTVGPANAGSTYFYSYSPTDSLAVTASGGDVRLVNDANAFRAVVGSPVASSTATFGVYPATLRVAAPSGDIEFVNSMRLLPSSTGQLELTAGGTLSAPSAGVSLLMSDVSPSAVPVAANPVGRDRILVAAQRSALDAIHIGDTEPVRLTAAGGDVSGGTYDLPKQFSVFAARDVRDTFIGGQNTDARQISLVEAGRDISLPDAGNGIELGGPGRLTLLAGRNLDLGFSQGVTTLGRTRTAQLPGPSGAAVDVWAGLQNAPAIAAFDARYWKDQFEQEFADYVAKLLPYVGQATGRADLDNDNVWAAYAGLSAGQQQTFRDGLEPAQRISFDSFAELIDTAVGYTALVTGRSDITPSSVNDVVLGLSATEQRPMVQAFFFRELRDSGREANLGGNLGFQRGQNAVATLFPSETRYDGDLSLVFSRIYTLDGGDINLLAPGGLLNVGLATLPANLPVIKAPSDLGIVTQGAGAVRIFTDGDVLVNQSRVFTLQGGDIVIWSSHGDIDAGRGSKSAISAPPPTITVSPTGEIVVQFSDAIAGSGIRGILTRADIRPGDVDLIAPSGEINAGDAGIGSAGNLNIAAPQVVGLDNIQVGGQSTGVPADAGGLAASLTGVSSVSSSAAEGAESTAAAVAAGQQDAAPIADAAMGWLDVYVEGFGVDDEDDNKKRRRP